MPQSIETPDQALSELRIAIEAGGLAYLAQGALLTEIRKRDWNYGAASFDEFCEKDLGIGARRARYLMQIFRWLVESGLDAEDLQDVGWCKLRVLASHIPAEMAGDWIEKAKTKTYTELDQAVRIENGHNQTRKVLRTKVFKLHEDQAELVDQSVKIVKGMVETEYDSVALELICIEFLNNLNPNDNFRTPRDAVVNLLRLASPDAALAMVRDAHPDHPIFRGQDEAV